MELKKNEQIVDILSKLKGKPVNVMLSNGELISCEVKTVGEFCSLIERKDSKSFYDIIIRNDSVIAVEMKVRNS
ncbi:MAG: hypothetical protein ACFFBP_02385 [Promethearchaeota archaeon]